MKENMLNKKIYKITNFICSRFIVAPAFPSLFVFSIILVASLYRLPPSTVTPPINTFGKSQNLLSSTKSSTLKHLSQPNLKNLKINPRL